MYIYCITNKVNGKKYIGQTTKTPEYRFGKHVGMAGKNGQTIHKAIAKYGKDSFVLEVLDEASSYPELLQKEQDWIKKLNTKIDGYNETDGGEGSWGRVISEKTREKHRRNILKRYEDPDYRKKVSASTKTGMKKWWNNLSETEQNEWKKNCATRPDGYVYPTGWTYSHTEEAKQKISKASLGKPKAKEHKKNMSKARRGKGTGINNAMASEENRKKVGLSKLGRKKVYMEDGSYKYLRPEQM